MTSPALAFCPCCRKCSTSRCHDPNLWLHPFNTCYFPGAWSVISSASSCLFKPTFPVAQKAHWKAHPTWPSQHSWYKAWGTQHWRLGGNTQRTVRMELQWNCLDLKWQHLIWMKLGKKCPNYLTRIVCDSCLQSWRRYPVPGTRTRASSRCDCSNIFWAESPSATAWLQKLNEVAQLCIPWNSWNGIWMRLEILNKTTGVHFPVALLGLVLIISLCSGSTHTIYISCFTKKQLNSFSML